MCVGNTWAVWTTNIDDHRGDALVLGMTPCGKVADLGRCRCGNSGGDVDEEAQLAIVGQRVHHIGCISAVVGIDEPSDYLADLRRGATLGRWGPLGVPRNHNRRQLALGIRRDR
jgi:hypothetical protein